MKLEKGYRSISESLDVQVSKERQIVYKWRKFGSVDRWLQDHSAECSVRWTSVSEEDLEKTLANAYILFANIH